MSERVYRSVSLRSLVTDFRTAKFDGEDHLVVPVVMLVEGVIQAMNAPSPELVLAERFSIAPSGWNGRPLFLNHPMDGSTPISGNSPEVLTRSFGKVFNVASSDKQLRGEVWINEKRATELGGDEAALASRVRANKKIEISTGAFIVLEDKKGLWQGVKYSGVWDLIYPDHLAILSEGSTGACSYAMGCGLRASSDGRMEANFRAQGASMDIKITKPEDVTSAVTSLEQLKVPAAERNLMKRRIIRAATRQGADFVAKLPADWKESSKPSDAGLMSRFAQFLGLQSPEEMGDIDLREELTYALNQVEPSFRYQGQVTVVYPQNNRVVYQMYEPEGVCYYSRNYTLDANGEATVDDTAVECERITSYEPIEPEDDLRSAVAKVVALAGARHSGKDQKMVQNMHDTAVNLGADCAAMKASSSATSTCGCGGKKPTVAATEPASW